jgi:hypothetical protein
MVAVVVAVVGAGAAAVIFGVGFGPNTRRVLAATSTSFTPAQARTIETALNNGVPAQVSSVIELGGAETFDPAAAAQFAQLHLRLDPGSFSTHDGNEASVNAVTSGAKPAHWVLLLAKSAGSWKIVATQQVGR